MDETVISFEFIWLIATKDQKVFWGFTQFTSISFFALSVEVETSLDAYLSIHAS